MSGSKVLKALKALKHFVAHLGVHNGGQRGSAGKWVTDDHDGGPGRPAAVFQLLSGGNGNGNGENPEENRFPLPVEAHGYSADAEKEGKSIGGSHGGEAISE